MPAIVTASWSTPLPDDHIRISISRGTPRGMPAGFRRYPRLASGPWCRNGPPADEWAARYRIEVLDPHRVRDDLLLLAGDRLKSPPGMRLENASNLPMIEE